MTRFEIANNINATHSIIREIALDGKLDLKVGDIYNNQNKIESWSVSHKYANFWIENDSPYKYVFKCDNVPCHEVDYDNEEEVEILNACEGEMEVLVLSDKKMKIVSISNDDDFEEMGYYEIQLEIIE